MQRVQFIQRCRPVVRTRVKSLVHRRVKISFLPRSHSPLKQPRQNSIKYTVGADLWCIARWINRHFGHNKTLPKLQPKLICASKNPCQ